MKKRLDLQLWHEGCWMLGLTRTYPDATLVVTDICSDGTDILATVVVSGDDLDLGAVADEAAAAPAVRSTDRLDGGLQSLRIHTRYKLESSIYDAIISSSLTPIGDIRIQDNAEYWTLLVDGGGISSAISTLEADADVDILRVTDYEPNPSTNHTVIDEIRDDLSVRQTEYLLSALEEGYYGWPRDIAAKDLAEKHDVSGPTALEHLRKGESVVLERILGEVKDRERSETAQLQSP
ncbi:bacterio-opsin activator HTH domain-containing protein [Natrialba hulunbeirensis JCM 10989]|uniref:Bacterio-opsin activator HTH domain-containing protein n=1 Tax=Natrialba hulunbeirensis JCM 10989 TaxID=1227493 RepID=M0A0Z2_9EURY|nr:helix-turn-helix domain-containing protein [Natrialba hulunbeirensis]ELY92299.1 bacterio-opsin activator HTH domain-containing protein [Natrialba hulunbeirensis JCM 10989]